MGVPIAERLSVAGRFSEKARFFRMDQIDIIHAYIDSFNIPALSRLIDYIEVAINIIDLTDICVLPLLSIKSGSQPQYCSRTGYEPMAGRTLPPPIECAYWESGEGEPLFLIHGIGASHATWDGVVRSLAGRYRCITYDLRGHGVSPLPDGKFDLEALVSDLEALREKLGIESAHFAGHSLGGMIGPAYARHFPSRVRTLGLLSTAAGRSDEDKAKVQGVVAAMERDGIPNILSTLVDRWYTDEFARNNPKVVEARLEQITSMSAEVFLNVFHIYAETEMAPWLHEVSAPSLVLTGELDGGCNPRLNRFIDSQLPNSELVILEGLKHSILMEAPSAVADHLDRFIKAHA